MKDLDKLLFELNEWLLVNELYIELIVIGAYAVRLHGISARATLDIDTLNEIKNERVIKKIDSIGEKYGLHSWLNNQAKDLILPNNFYEHTVKHDGYSNIAIQYASRLDLIRLKMAAYYYRHEYEQKDLDDLLALAPSVDEFEHGVAFLKEKHAPTVKAFKEKFIIDVDQIMSQLRGKLYG